MSGWERWTPLAGVIQLFAIVFVPVFVYSGWLLLASALLTLRSLRSPTATAP